MAVRLGELLLREKRVTPVQLQEALNYQRQNGGRLGTSLVKLGIVADDDITAVVSRQLRRSCRSISASSTSIRPSYASSPARARRKYNVLPVARPGTTLTLAMADPTNVFAMDDIKFMTGLHVEPVVASETAIREAIARYFREGRPEASNAQGRRPRQPRARGARHAGRQPRGRGRRRGNRRGRRSSVRAAKRRSSSWSTR